MRISYTHLLFAATTVCGSVGCFPKKHCPEVYETPKAALEVNIQEALDQGPFLSGNWPQEDWWTIFNDTQLNELLERALAHNPDLKVAQARVRLASYAAQAAKSPFWPQLNMEADSTRYRTSKNGALATAQQVPAAPPGLIFTQTEINLSASYQFDIWQQNANHLKAVVGELLATEADAAFSAIMISTSLAQAYFALQATYERQEIAKEKIENRAKYLKLTERRLDNGLDNLLTLKLAESSLKEAEESLKEIVQEITIYKNQIYALINGDFASDIDAMTLAKRELDLFPLPTNLPLNLIAHRPDVTAAAWRAEEAARNIKVARASFYPNVNIIGLFGFQALHTNELFHTSSTYGDVGPAINLPIFQGGLLQANVGMANEQYVIAVEQYNKTVLGSVKNVLDTLSGLTSSYNELEDFRVIRDLSAEVYGITEARFLHHLDSSLKVLDARLDVLDKEDTLLVAIGLYYGRFIDLISALGGGYEYP